MSTAVYQAELEELRKAFAAGVLSIKQRDKTVTFGSADDLMRRMQFLERKITPKQSARVAGFSRGDG